MIVFGPGLPRADRGLGFSRGQAVDSRAGQKINICRPIPTLVAVFVFLVSAASGAPAPESQDILPKSVAGELSYSLSGRPRSFDRESMYEQVNGEAELFKRFGAERLIYAVYSGPNGSSLTVDAVQMCLPEAAFGLFRLYAGCDGPASDQRLQTGRFCLDGPVAFAFAGRLFLRLSAYDAKDLATLVRRLMEALPASRDADFAQRLAALEMRAQRPCDVRYFPDAVDPRFDTGPGYRWVTRTGRDAAVAQCLAGGCGEIEGVLKGLGEKTVASGASHVAWIRGGEAQEVEDLRAIVSLFDAGVTH